LRSHLLAGLIAAMSVVATLAWAGLNMRPGLWEIATTLNGAPVGTVKKCYLPKDVNNLEASQHGAGPMANPHCKTSGYQAVGDMVTFRTTCKEHGETTVSDAEVVFEGDRTAGEIRSDNGTTTSFESRRVGDCSVSSFGK